MKSRYKSEDKETIQGTSIVIRQEGNDSRGWEYKETLGFKKHLEGRMSALLIQ